LNFNSKTNQIFPAILLSECQERLTEAHSILAHTKVLTTPQ